MNGGFFSAAMGGLCWLWRKGVNQRESLRVGLELFRRLVLLLLLEEEELENV